ncbi:hypothetical protein ACWDX6_02240 [Streptomyces sp. NPDC003027]
MEHHAKISGTAVVLALALPVGLYLLMVSLLHSLPLSAADPFQLLLISLTLAVLLAAVLLAAAGVAVAVCLLVITLVPFVTVIGYETIGHRHQQRMLRRFGTR